MATQTFGDNPEFRPRLVEPPDSSTRALASVPTGDVLTRYSKLLFFERFNDMVMATHEYGGKLPEAWDTAEPLAVPDISVEPSPKPSKQQEREIEQAALRLRNAGITSVVMEAAHVYMHDDLDDPAFQEGIRSQCQQAAMLTERLEQDDVRVRQILFVDDYNPAPPERRDAACQLDVDEYIELTRSMGYRPELLLKEASMVPLARRIIETMHGLQDLVVVEQIDEGVETPADAFSGDRALLARRNVELYRQSDDIVSCAMLDAALTVVKFRYLGEGVVNILPRRINGQGFSYNGQQKKMRTIIGEHLRVRVTPVFNIFTGDQPVDEIAAGAHNIFRKPHKVL
jgi:hypothetical protein